jgi:acyl-coenzyme A synthetase/AMP-(fatty) acid ligase
MFWMQRAHPLERADVQLQKTPFGFDASVWEFFAPLLAGARLVMARPGGHLDAAYLAETILLHGVSILQLVPSQLHMLLQEPTFWRCAPPLKNVYCGGEPLTKELCEEFYRRLPRASLHNLYGPTEACIDSTSWDCPHDGIPAAIPVGRPIHNTRTYIVNAWMQPSPIGVPGELLVSGTGLARGYLNEPGLTAEKFVQDPFRTELGARVYKTGDLARFLPDGNIEFLRRMDDHQVKIRGFRVELGEIEAVLAEHPEVRQVAVHLWRVAANDVRIVACCVPAKAGALAPLSLRKHLQARLPEYMVPQYFVPVEEIPLTPNGKVDRRRLPTPVVTESGIGQHETPADPVEAKIAEIWTKLLQPARPIGRNDRFFEMGGHSLLGLQALRQMEYHLGVKLDFRVLFQENLAELATRCRSERVAGNGRYGGGKAAES